MTSKEYWADRQKQRVVDAELQGRLAISKLQVIYNEAYANIRDAINRTYASYSRATGLSVDELAVALNAQDRTQYIASLSRALGRAGLDIKGVFDDRYISRLTRLEALKKQIYYEVLALAELEKNITTQTYGDILAKSYAATRNDLRELGGVQGTFAQLDTRVAGAMLRENWFGGNYKTRINGHRDKFVSRLQAKLGGALTSGSGLEKVASDLQKEFQVARYDAVRLVRTETNYFHNQAELEAYKDDGIEKYEFLEVLDGRTSDICREAGAEGNNIHKVENAVVGDNYPPLHPNCRSTTIPVVELS
jgi:SPP1 gp7 family putative phage head morphogenesis protein